MSNKILSVAVLPMILSACGGGSGGSGQSPSDPSPKVNQPPIASDVIITDVNGGDAQVGDSLTLTYRYSDADNDTEGASLIRWLRDDVEINGAGTLTYQLQSDDAEKNIHAEVTPVAQSGQITGASVLSSTVLVKAIPDSGPNRAPVASNVVITDSNGGSLEIGDELILSYDYNDQEKDAEGVSKIQWTVGKRASDVTANRFIVQANQVGNSIQAQVIPVATSGTLEGVAVMSNSLIVNIPRQKPVARNVEITDINGGTIQVGDTINLAYDYKDANGDEEGESVIRWLRNGTEIAGANERTYQITLDDQNKSLTADVTPVAKTGGTDYLIGERVASEVITIPANQSPVAKNLVITDVNGGDVNPGDVLTVSYDYSDADGDAEDTGSDGTLISWKYSGNNGGGYIPQGRGQTSYTISSQYVGARISAEVSPKALTGHKNGLSFESNQVVPIKITRDLNFGQSELKLLQGDTRASAATLADSSHLNGGTIQYSSENNKVATVNADGQITALANGTALVYANLAEDAAYESTSAQLEVTISDGAFDVSAWLGADETELLVTPAGDDLGQDSLTLNLDLQCYMTECGDAGAFDLEVYKNQAFPSSVYTLGTNKPKHIDVNFGDYQTSLVMGPASNDFWIGQGRAYVEFDGKLWAFGGGDRSVGANNETWQSLDGIHWHKVNTSGYTTFSKRFDHQVVVFKDKLWMIAGSDTDDQYRFLLKKDIWSSEDGLQWQLETSTPAFSARRLHKVVAANGKLWLQGNDTDPNDNRRDKSMWSSSDGIQWTNQGYAPLAGRQSALASFKGKSGDTTQPDLLLSYSFGTVRYYDSNGRWQEAQYLYGGDLGNAAPKEMRFAQVGKGEDARMLLLAMDDGSNDVTNAFISADGKTWQHLDNSQYRARDDASLVAFNHQFLLLGGRGYYTGIEHSHDGINWRTGGSDTSVVGRHSAATAVFNDQLIMAGGSTRKDIGMNQVQTSHDGLRFDLRQPDGESNALPESLPLPTMVTFKNELWLSSLNRVFRSRDGASWREVTTSGYETYRYVDLTQKLVTLNGQLYSLSAERRGALRVYRSDDGVSWSKIATLNTVSNDGFSVTRFKDQLWIIGGVGGGVINSAWVSTDGIAWDLVTAQGLGSIPVSDAEVVEFNGKLWMLGGAGNQGNVYNSDDGQVWQKTINGETSNMFTHRTGHNLVVWKNYLYLLGGRKINAVEDSNEAYLNDVWRMDQNGNWQKGFQSSIELHKAESEIIPIPL